MSDFKHKIDFGSARFLRLPLVIKKNFLKLENFRKETNMPAINHPDNRSTIALLIINNREFWGANKATAGITDKMKDDLKALLKDENSRSAHSVVLTHAEVDAIVAAHYKNMNADSAEMYVDRKLCGFCAGKDFNAGSLRRLLPLLSLQILKVYTPDENGNITEVTLKTDRTFVSHIFL